MTAIQNHFSKAAILALAGVLMAHGATLSGTVSGGKGVAVVYIDAIPGKTFPAPEKHVVEDQKQLLFQPHAIVVLAGSTVDFLNSDTVQHNIFWPAISGNKKMSHNMGTWPKGEIRSFKFDAPGVVPLLCNVHPEMSGFIVVVPTPYYAEAEASGAFKIENVPDGSYTVTAWREGMKPQSKPVTVSGTATADFALTK
ncbi:MAG TPA: carboxypeptidase regulatory-like domain-containing protein [Bryobacteraceae bacterium]|nr:carboxypeptidase regulatory-like domain-containing protein [Bryobacteraceae bacterium]